MSGPTYVLMMNANQPSNTTGSALASSAALTDISGGGNTAGQAFTIQAGLMYVGQTWRWTASGIYGTTATPTLTLGLYYGGVGGTAIAATVAVTTPSGVTTQSWRMEAISRVTGVGTSGTIVTQGYVQGIQAVSTGAASASTTMMPETTATGGQATINTSTSNIVTVGAQWGTSNASNTITCYQFIAELLT